MLRYRWYEQREPEIPAGGIPSLSDEDLQALIEFRTRERNNANDSMERACAEARKRGLR